MNKSKISDSFPFYTGVVAYPILFVLLVWVVYWAEVRFGFKLNHLGIDPRKVEGLTGVFASPFIHSGISHLYHNTIPLFVLSMALFYFYRPIAWKVVLYGILLSGILTWLIGRPANHIGASGLIYVLVSFIFFKGIITKHYRLVALSLLVVFLYGSMVWYALPVKEGISWEGHLSGFVTGIFFALAYRNTITKPKKYVWEQEDYNEEEDEFMKHFDENGNFIEFKEANQNASDSESTKITYTYKPKDR